jgi:hypothetical protein
MPTICTTFEGIQLQWMACAIDLRHAAERLEQAARLLGAKQKQAAEDSAKLGLEAMERAIACCAGWE